MADFSYIAVNKLGEIKRGLLSSSTCKHVRKILASRSLELISCEEKEKESFGLNLDVVDFFKRIFFKNITPLEKISFAHHLSIMLKAGVSIVEAVEVLENETASPKFREVIKQLIVELKKGKTLSSFLEKEKVFSPAHLAILKAGEASGKIIDSLARIAIDLKRDYRLRKKIKGAMAYPMVITITLLVVSGFIVVFVLPNVGDVFKQMKLEMPLPTRILLFIGSFISQYFLQILIAFILLISIFFLIFKRLNIGKEIFSKIARFIPVVKKIVYQLNMARFIRSLSSLLESGVPISESLAISGEVFDDKRQKLVIEKICQKVKKGVSLTEAFKTHQDYFEAMLVKMCSVGEKSGNLALILDEVAVFYEEEVEGRLDNFSTIIEPILMLLVGLGVGGMIFTIIGPIYQMMGKLNP